MTSNDKPVHFSPYTNVYDADNMRRVPPDIHTPEELMAWLKKRGQPLTTSKRAGCTRTAWARSPG